MSLLEVQNLTHAFGGRTLYRGASFALNKGEHAGIVGPNGSGKSTLIKILTDQITPDSGRVIWQPGLSAGYLDQYAEIKGDLTMRDFLRSAFQRYADLERTLLALYEKAADGDSRHLSLAARYQEQLDRSDFYYMDTRIEQVAAGLGLTAIGLERPVGKMSGGQRAKAILAKLLLEKPDVLLLDEPTNFLDREHIDWLSGWLSGLEQSFLIVSHDPAFLNRTANRICDIDNRSITKYYGTYSEFLEKKARLREDYIRQYAAQQKEIKKTEAFIQKYRAGRKANMAKGRQKQLDRMERMEAVSRQAPAPCFQFAQLPLASAEVLRVDRLRAGYQKPVLSDLRFRLKGGEKAVVTGFNGVGKSTLLKTLTGQIPALGGSFRFSGQAAVGYFEQELKWTDPAMTPIQIVSDAYPAMARKEIRKRLALCGIAGEHAMQAVSLLSGGEQAKVKLCLLTLSPCNFLILDEPTNHLDAQAKEALRQALAEFPGTVLLVSHEEAFFSDWAQTVIPIGASRPRNEDILQASPAGQCYNKEKKD